MNYLYNFFFVDKSYQNIHTEKLLNFLVALLFSIFLYELGKILKPLLNVKFNSTGIVIFLLSFYIFDKSFLIVSRFIPFKYSFVIVLIGWILFIIRKNIQNLSNLTTLLFSYIISFSSLNIFNRFLTLSEENFLTSDERYFWLPVSKNIYEYNLFESLLNSPLPSYGLLIGHMNAVLNQLFSYSENFLYFPAYKNLFFFLTIFLIYELPVDKVTKFVSSSIITVIVLTSDWFTYLFFNSLLAESISSYFFGVLFIELIKNKEKLNKSLVLCLGFLYFSKQFISLFAILYGIYYLLIEKKPKFFYGLLLYGIIIDFINSLFLKIPITWRMYTDSFRSDATTGEGGINLKNILNIIQQFLIDRPVTYFIFITFLISLFIVWNFGFYERESLFLILLNTVFVFMLYIFIWTNVEYESSYRYLLNIFHVILLFFVTTLNNFLILSKK